MNETDRANEIVKYRAVLKQFINDTKKALFEDYDIEVSDETLNSPEAQTDDKELCIGDWQIRFEEGEAVTAYFSDDRHAFEKEVMVEMDTRDNELSIKAWSVNEYF